MAVTELWGPTWVNVVWEGTADYGLTQTIKLRSVRFQGGAANDKLCVMQAQPGVADSANWPFFVLTDITGAGVAMFEPSVGLNPKPATYYIDYSKSTLTANCIIQFVFE